MKVLHKTAELLMFAVFVFMCGLALYAAWSRAHGAAVGWMLDNGRLTLASIGLGGICLAAIYALAGASRPPRDRFLAFPNESGVVSISTTAITDYIGKLAGEFPSIVGMTPRVVPRHKAVDIVVDIRIKAGPQLHEICEVLQKRVRESMASGLGISEVRRVVVKVRQISSEHKAA
jgi:uncharacterized alkaline shock family protein YloU